MHSYVLKTRITNLQINIVHATLFCIVSTATKLYTHIQVKHASRSPHTVLKARFAIFVDDYQVGFQLDSLGSVRRWHVYKLSQPIQQHFDAGSIGLATWAQTASLPPPIVALNCDVHTTQQQLQELHHDHRSVPQMIAAQVDGPPTSMPKPLKNLDLQSKGWENSAWRITSTCLTHCTIIYKQLTFSNHTFAVPSKCQHVGHHRDAESHVF